MADNACVRYLVLTLCLAGCAKSPEELERSRREDRLACRFGPGALAKETLGDTRFLGDKMPIDHIVYVMMENRSFDHYFSELDNVRKAPPDASMLAPDGTLVTRKRETRYCVRDIGHSWNPSHLQWNDGKNDGFARVAGGDDPARALGYYGESDIPYYYGLARAFAISDMHFASFLGGTWPNRIFALAGTSFGSIRNEPAPVFAPSESRPNLFEALDARGVDFRVYISDVPTLLLFLDSYARFMDRVRPVDHYFEDVAAGDLPPFVMVEPAFSGSPRNDEHAPNDIQLGQQFSSRVANALMASPLWARSALFLSWDEGGGFYDSVPPPEACDPGDPPKLDPDSQPGAFDRLGFRVPLIVASPFAKRGHVSHNVSDHTSVLRFIEARFELEAMTARDANADALLDMFDFSHPVYDVPALPEAVVDPEQYAACYP